jgi:hypothetical protein
MSTNANPLQKHFRRPAIYVKLPSDGRCWPEGSLELTATGEIPVYPMTTKDEITIRTPDALFNGTGVVDVLQSCMPNIKDAWKMPSTDVDAALIAIRIASYSPNMDIETKCIHCSEENTYSVDLNNVLQNIRFPNYNDVLSVDNLEIKFKPQMFFEANKTNLVNFEEQKLLATVSDSELEESERGLKFMEHMKRILDLNIQSFVDSTEYIKTEDGTIVSEKVFIYEFYSNADRKVIATIKAHLDKLNETVKIKPVSVNCGDCSKPFNIAIQFDYSNFFV